MQIQAFVEQVLTVNLTNLSFPLFRFCNLISKHYARQMAVGA